MKNNNTKYFRLINQIYGSLTFLVVLFSTSTVAQYQSLFGTQTTSWNIKTSQLYGDVLDSLWYDKDTLIQGEKYYIVTNGFTDILFSEDTTMGTAWYLKVNAINDTLIEKIYDLSLSVGDTFNGKIVDSIYFVDGKKHIRLNWQPNGMEGEKWVLIEGVGTNIGFFFNSINPVLLCQRKNDTINFMNTHPIYGGQCNLNGVSVRDMSGETTIELRPNPAGDEVYLLNLKKTTVYFIYDLNGRIVKKGNVGIDGRIALENIQPGTYFLSVDGMKEKLIIN